MKRFQGLCAATTLLFVLTGSALAGEITTGAVSPPPPPSASAIITEPCDTTTDEAGSAPQADSWFSEITLSLVQLLSVI
jgi:hypothetical protein